MQRIEENQQLEPGNAKKRKRCLGGQGRPPSPLLERKQAKISCYLKEKSPKAENARARKRPDPGTSSQEITENVESINNRGPTAPFWETRGRSQNLPTAETLAGNLPSESRVGGAVVWGRPTRKRSEDKDRDQETLALGKMTPGRRKGLKGSTGKAPKVKEVRSKQAGMVRDIRLFFEEKVGSLSSSQETGRKEEGRNGSNEPDLGNEPVSGNLKGKEPTGEL